jgi:hypothetical protein
MLARMTPIRTSIAGIAVPDSALARDAAGMRDKPETAFATMNTDILEATVPGYVRPNLCDCIRDSRFAA